MITNMLLYKYNIEGALMYNILFYRNENGRSEVKEYLFQLQNKQEINKAKRLLKDWSDRNEK